MDPAIVLHILNHYQVPEATETRPEGAFLEEGLCTHVRSPFSFSAHWSHVLCFYRLMHLILCACFCLCGTGRGYLVKCQETVALGAGAYVCR